MKHTNDSLDKSFLGELLLSGRRIEGDHWIWNRGKQSRGYGLVHVRIKGVWKSYTTHRLSAHVWLNLDLNDRGSMACHKQCCLRRDCFNPDHLYVGDVVSNGKDMVDAGHAGTYWRQKTHCKNGHEFTLENTGWYFNKKFGAMWRECKTCKRENRKRYRSAA